MIESGRISLVVLALATELSLANLDFPSGVSVLPDLLKAKNKLVRITDVKTILLFHFHWLFDCG